MSIKLGKTKNWGSRTGKSTPSVKNAEISTLDLLKAAGLSTELLQSLVENSEIAQSAFSKILTDREVLNNENSSPVKKYFSTDMGVLYEGNCFTVLSNMDDNSLDCIFADPPFNLSKEYNNGLQDKMSDMDYLDWSRAWIDLCIQKLKPGGAFFLYNIPKWNISLAPYMDKKLSFRHWITVDMTFSMPIPSKLYPSHYSLLYFTKGDKPNHFTPPRIPIKTCVKCGKEQNDYGGYKNKMNPAGINIRDVWSDIPPVRHNKYKNRDANELSIKLLDRVLDIATKEGDLVFDPFGGSGTTYIVAEMKGRRWIGSELGDCSPIKERFDRIKEEQERLIEMRKEINTLFTDKALRLRVKSGVGLKHYNIPEEQIERVFGKDSPLILSESGLH